MVDAGEPEEAARGFIEYWLSPGAYDAMQPRIRELVTMKMVKLLVEFPSAFE